MGRTCFVIMPFDDFMTELYHGVIKVAVEHMGCRAVRADEIYEPGTVIDQIVDNIHQADFVIADVTGKNANVNFELGIAYECKKKIILITQSVEDAPFDYRHQRLLAYTPGKIDWNINLNKGLIRYMMAVQEELNREEKASVAATGRLGEEKKTYDQVNLVDLALADGGIGGTLGGEAGAGLCAEAGAGPCAEAETEQPVKDTPCDKEEPAVSAKAPKALRPGPPFWPEGGPPAKALEELVLREGRDHYGDFPMAPVPVRRTLEKDRMGYYLATVLRVHETRIERYYKLDGLLPWKDAVPDSRPDWFSDAYWTDFYGDSHWLRGWGNEWWPEGKLLRLKPGDHIRFQMAFFTDFGVQPPAEHGARFIVPACVEKANRYNLPPNRMMML